MQCAGCKNAVAQVLYFLAVLCTPKCKYWFLLHVSQLFKMTKDQPVAQKCTCMFAGNEVLYRYMKSILWVAMGNIFPHNVTLSYTCVKLRIGSET